MVMTLYLQNIDRMTRDEILHASLGTRDEANIDLYRRMMEDGRYEKVAEFDGDDLEFVWMATQNGVRTTSWFTEPLDGVRPLNEANPTKPRRSTMIGDIVVRDGIMHVVDMMGFTEIGPLPAAVLPDPVRM